MIGRNDQRIRGWRSGRTLRLQVQFNHDRRDDKPDDDQGDGNDSLVCRVELR
jgi:hypothetical protein